MMTEMLLSLTETPKYGILTHYMDTTNILC